MVARTMMTPAGYLIRRPVGVRCNYLVTLRGYSAIIEFVVAHMLFVYLGGLLLRVHGTRGRALVVSKVVLVQAGAA